MKLIELDKDDILVIRGQDLSDQELADLRGLKDLVGCKAILYVRKEFDYGTQVPIPFDELAHFVALFQDVAAGVKFDEENMLIIRNILDRMGYDSGS